MDRWVTGVLIIATVLLAIVAVPEFAVGAILAMTVSELLKKYTKLPEWAMRLVVVAVFIGTAVAIPIALNKPISGGSSDDAASCYRGACN